MKLKIFITTVLLFFAAATPTKAATYYVSTNGNDSNTGTSLQSSFRTFTKALSLLNGGGTMLIGGGTYNQQLIVSQNGTSQTPIVIGPAEITPVIVDIAQTANETVRLSGSYINLSGITTKNSHWACVNITGTNINVDNLTVTGCLSHGIISSGQNISVKNSTIYETVQENNPTSESNQWGSALKVDRGANGVTYSNNTVYHNYGEGVGVTMGKNVTISGNRIYDNFSVNLYIDNSSGVVATNNFITCSPTATAFFRNGKVSAGIAISEESYTGWGAQLQNITIENNINAFCGSGITYWIGVSGSGLNTTTISHNTIWNIAGSPLSIEYGASKQQGNIIADNIFKSASNTQPWVQNRTGIDLHHNFWASAASSGSNATGTGDATGTPIFVTTPAYTASSYIQSPSSPAIDFGANPALTTLSGDITGQNGVPDGIVDIFDYNFIVGQYNNTGVPGWILADITGPNGVPDGKVDLYDANIVIQNFGR